jgi:hypothetical protein
MSIELLVAAGASAAALISAILGGGLLTRFIAHSNELAVTKHVVEQMQLKLESTVEELNSLKNNSIEVSTKVAMFSEHIKKMEMIPEIAAKLASMETLIGSVQSLVSMLAQEYNSHSD